MENVSILYYYNKIDACPNDCMLYWKEAEEATSCSKCGASRYESGDKNSLHKKIPAKTLRHFPLIPRLQRLYMSSKTSLNMRWHHESREDDQRLRHPADGQAWKEFDKLHPYFSEEPRNIRLGLASDGFNPYNGMSSKYSIWPVVVMPYNLPPWLCMKPDFLFLTLLIPGPQQPGNDIDIYLQPLIEELKELWYTGVVTYDVIEKKAFKLSACLLWTINDFPAYAVLSGWSTKGALACPCCNEESSSRWLKYGRKHSYMGHRRFLPQDHRFRHDKRNFDGHEENRLQPKMLSGDNILEQLQGVQFPPFGKENVENVDKTRKKRKRSFKKPELPLNWKKKSIFFELPYWKSNLLRHNLDVMHIEKNVSESIIGTLLDIKEKTKDSVNARLDLREMKIRSDLQPKFVEGKNKLFIPPACYTMSSVDKDLFCKNLKGVKVPIGLCSNISRCVQERNLIGMKSHDHHIMMQQLLPVALRGVLPKNVSIVLIELCAFFRDLCSKVGKEDDFKKLGEVATLTLCKMERIFPPSFFDVMVHLIIHLANEASIAGPVQYRWMYPIERYLRKLKVHVRNLSRPEGSIAEGYIAEECLTFYSRYFEGVEASSSITSTNDGMVEVENPNSIFSRVGMPIGKCEMIRLGFNEMDQAHRYVLANYDAIEEYRELHKCELKRTMGRNYRAHDISKRHAKEFPKWFDSHILNLREKGGDVPYIIRWLARGPNIDARCYDGYIINGIKFHSKAHESCRKTQNSGVLVTAMTESYASQKDKNPVEGNVPYYGILNKVIELEYAKDIRVMLFHCDWVDINKGVEKDELGFVLVNFNNLLYSGHGLLDEPFVFPSQAEQVFYITDTKKPEWKVAIKTRSRGIFDMQGEDDDESDQAYTQNTLQCIQNLDLLEGDNESDVSWVRSDVDGILVDTPSQLGNLIESSDGNISN